MASEQYYSPVFRQDIFKGKVLFATGGNGSIISVMAKAFVQLGGTVCILGRDVSKTNKVAAEIAAVRQGGQCIGLAPVDVRDAKALVKAAKDCADQLGGIDFAIAGAAGNFLAPMSQLSANAFKSVIDIDALGSYNTAKAVLPYLVESAKKNPNTGGSSSSGSGGRIIFISATFHYTGKPLQAHVAAAKAAVDQIAISTAIEYGPYGVTSNVITPGPIQGTEGMERLAKSDEAVQEALLKSIPLLRMGTKKEISDAMIYLFSEAGSYVSGSIVVVDGGNWRISSGNMGGFQYPDFLLMGDAVSDVKSGKESKL